MAIGNITYVQKVGKFKMGKDIILKIWGEIEFCTWGNRKPGKYEGEKCRDKDKGETRKIGKIWSIGKIGKWRKVK